MAQGKITKKQEEILTYIKSQILSRGFPPSVREICEAVNLKSTSSVHSHLETLEKNGYIHRDPTKPREILDDTFNLTRREVVNVPIIGHIAAGEPLLAQENIENYFPVPVEMLPNKQTYLLVVQGESMINAGILNGDYVLIQPLMGIWLRHWSTMAQRLRHSIKKMVISVYSQRMTLWIQSL